MLHPHRSRLIMPITNERFIQKGPLRNADIIVLDLEDSIPNSEKLVARSLLKQSIDIVCQGGSAIYVRVNNQDGLLRDDIRAAVHNKLTGIYVPKVESEAQVEDIDQYLTSLEQEHGLEEGSIQLAVLIESAKGLLNMNAILQASRRTQSVSLGVEDLVEDMHMKNNEQTADVLKNIRMQVCIAARANQIVPLGLMSSITNYNDLEKLAEGARLAYMHGFAGNSCVHPSNVEIFNNTYMPTEEEVARAKKLMEAFEEALSQKKAAITFEGKMIDIPHYENAKKLIAQYDMYSAFDKQKQIHMQKYKQMLKDV